MAFARYNYLPDDKNVNNVHYNLNGVVLNYMLQCTGGLIITQGCRRAKDSQNFCIIKLWLKNY